LSADIRTKIPATEEEMAIDIDKGFHKRTFSFERPIGEKKRKPRRKKPPKVKRDTSGKTCYKKFAWEV
jgi:hypothetical protein